MILYILKISACLLILIAFYKLFLESENMHMFKRFYLMASIVIALIIPSIVFTEYVYIEPQTLLATVAPDAISEEFQNTPISEDSNYLNTILWSIYAIGVFVFGFKFCQNLLKIGHRIRKNPKIKNQHITNVLLKEKLAPHTFFNFIFLNKQKFEAQEIPNEVLLHEKTHASQKHSIDVLFIELLQVIFWFNPLVYVFKKAMKLNHEFLADQAVMQGGVETSAYQKILLVFSSSSDIQETALANAINYSSIKKRFTVMKKNTSKKAIWLRSLFVLPLFALVLYSFSETQIIEMRQPSEIINYTATKHTARSITINVLRNGNYEIDGIKVNKNTFKQVINQLHQDITQEIRNNVINIHVNSPKDISDKEVWFIYNSVLDYGFYRIVAYNQEVVRPKGNTPFALENEDITIHINKNGQLLVQNDLVDITNLSEYLSKLNSALTKEQRSKQVRALIHVVSETPKQVVKEVNSILEEYGCATINIVGPVENQDGATKAQISEYNVLAKKYNSMNPNNMRIKKSEADRMEYLYSLMTEKQKKSAEAYPEIPPMPEPPMPPSPPDHDDADVEEKIIYKIIKKQDVDDKHSGSNDKNIKKIVRKEIHMHEDERMEQEGMLGDPPMPPTPKSPLDHIIELAKQDATFYYEGTNISSDKAIDLLKKDKYLNIDIRNITNKKPIVRISKEPISIED